jgi:hypothetical protein
MNAPIPTQKHCLKLTPRTHSRRTQNNIPGSVPRITPVAPRRLAPLVPTATIINTPCRSPRLATNTTPTPAATRTHRICSRPIEGGVQARNFITQEAINLLSNRAWANTTDVWTPMRLKPKPTQTCLDLQQVAMPMVHPTTGEFISSYKR